MARSVLQPIVVSFFLALAVVVLGPLVKIDAPAPATSSASTVVLFQNVRIFDAAHGTLSPLVHVLVRSNRIERISTEPISITGEESPQVIDGGGRTLLRTGAIEEGGFADLLLIEGDPTANQVLMKEGQIQIGPAGR